MARETVSLQEPTVARWLFNSTDAAWIWLVVRLYLGYEWLHAGYEKIFQEHWLSSTAPLKGFIGYALQGAGKGDHSAVNYGWYAAFLRWVGGDGAPFMSKLIAIGEFTIGILLILGLFTGIAAFLAGILSVSFGLAGVAGVNPAFFVMEVLLILAWRNAGYIGLDRWVLPALGTPWEPGKVFEERNVHRAHQVA